MSLGDFLRKQLIDVIQWTEDGDGVLAVRYPMQDMEIQYGARLTVRESQLALFVNEGKIADQFGPGLYTLEGLPQSSVKKGSMAASTCGRTGVVAA